MRIEKGILQDGSPQLGNSQARNISGVGTIMAGFFKASTLYRKAPLAMVPRCGACGLHETCKSPKMRPTGEGRRKILIVGEAPGKTEDEENRQFCGKTGERLERKLI